MQHRVGIIGWPISHSLSPTMHNAAFAELGMADWLYDAMAIPPDIPQHAINEPKRHGYIGLNVTVPFKEVVMRYVRPDDKALAIGAVNTIDFRDDSATNTDVNGFMDDLAAHGVNVADKRVLILGAGGASRAAIYGLWQAGAQVAVVNRTPQRVDELLIQLTLTAGIRTVSHVLWDDVPAWQPEIMVNCTSAGMWPNITESPWALDSRLIPEGLTVYDMVYRPAKTRLMLQVEARGGRAIGGLGMLVRQGAAAFELWTGRQAPVAVMFAAVEAALKQREEIA